MHIGILNTTIATTDGSYEIHTITVEQAKEFLSEAIAAAEAEGMGQSGYVSHVGHDATAEILTNILGIEVAMNRTPFYQQQGQAAIVMKMKGRIPEGTIIKTIEELDAIGYELKLMVRLPDCCAQPVRELRQLFDL